MYLIRTFLRKNYTFCAFRKLLIDKHAGITCCLHKFHRHSHCKRDFSTSSFLRCKLSRKSGNIEDILIKDVALETLVDPTGSGRDMTGDLDSALVGNLLREFEKRPQVCKAAESEGLREPFYNKAMDRFISFVMDNLNQLPPQLHIMLYDMVNSEGKSVDELFPYFLAFAKKIYPQFEFQKDLQLISDLTQPANWYPEARRMKRKIIFHAGPTNSGKTYHALKAFMAAESGVYCGPLRLLAMEVFNKCLENDVPCDLITGEERRHHFGPDRPAAHISSTVEMTSTTMEYDVAVVDEIQMLRDQERGGAWTRVLLGLCAREVHLCGEEAAVKLVERIVENTGDTLEVRRYERLSKLKFDGKPIETLKDVKAGDCLVCFSKAMIYKVCIELEKLGHNVAVIYGSLPPATKLAQAQKFNNPKDPCKVLVATDAIGMGINLKIKRMIFLQTQKTTRNERGELVMLPIATHQAKQIAGRAGRFGSGESVGLVTAYTAKEMNNLKEIIRQDIEDIQAAGLLPTVEQLEQFYFYLPSFNMRDILEIFEHMSTLNNDVYFLCGMESFKELIGLIEHIDLPLRVRYQFCMAPVSVKSIFLSTLFTKFARSYSNGTPIDCKWLLLQTDYPWSLPKTIKSLAKLEEVHEIMDMYLWLSFRFEEIFCDRETVRGVQKQLEVVIEEGVEKLGVLLSQKMDDKHSKVKKMTKIQKSKIKRK
uniref:RNA helicase n=1 Tax=Crassostrea virginica TaxID=6565 RepID=A0A8B8EAT0_CRAVI|nr:ATP-dependent RNA helicase SUV3 homolog, mitochondrial-like [Crassostrea virginica]